VALIQQRREIAELKRQLDDVRSLFEKRLHDLAESLDEVIAEVSSEVANKVLDRADFDGRGFFVDVAE
jgi:hypothetical protein